MLFSVLSIGNNNKNVTYQTYTKKFPMYKLTIIKFYPFFSGLRELNLIITVYTVTTIVCCKCIQNAFV